MIKKKKFTMTKGFYFFNVKMGFSNNITISRPTRKEAEYAYNNYIKQSKNIEWLGKWDGKKFTETEITMAA